MHAIKVAARDETRDRHTILHIIEQLDSDDPAVRLLAISVLERLTGETHGYVHYAPRYERNEAVARWVAEYGSAEGDADG